MTPFDRRMFTFDVDNECRDAWAAMHQARSWGSPEAARVHEHYLNRLLALRAEWKRMVRRAETKVAA